MPWGLTPADLFSITIALFWLIVLEGLLSGDNALVLAVMVRHLPKEQRSRALRYGIWGAFLFRLIAVLCASYLLRYWQLKVIGGLYLLFLALRHMFDGRAHEHASDATGQELLAAMEEAIPLGEESTATATAATTQVAHNPPRRLRLGEGFWGTVVSVELADIAFSIDSILAAVAMARGLPQKFQDHRILTLGIIYFGGIIGIVMMRLVAGAFIYLLDRFKGLAAGAYWLVAWIGLKLVGGGLHDAFLQKEFWNSGWRASLPDAVKAFPHWEMPDWFFWTGMALIVVVSMLYRHGPTPPESAPEPTAP